MSERNELADILNEATFEDGLPTIDFTELQRAADAILAAGYRKPRTVTTAAELDALPMDSAVGCFDSADGTLLQVYSQNVHGEWMALGTGLTLTSEGICGGNDYYLTVLHEATA